MVETLTNGGVACANLEAIDAWTSNSAIKCSRYPDDFNYMEPVGIRYLIVNRGTDFCCPVAGHLSSLAPPNPS